MLQPEIVTRRRAEARARGLSLARTPCGAFRVAFVDCTTFNYCKCDQSCCSDPLRRGGSEEGIPRTAEEFLSVPVLSAHFVGHRKPGELGKGREGRGREGKGREGACVFFFSCSFSTSFPSLALAPSLSLTLSLPRSLSLSHSLKL